VLGSSLTIPPASGIPEISGRKKAAKLAICNLQSTPLDELSDVRVFAKTDDLMVRVMEKLDIPIPSFILHRRLAVGFEGGEGKWQLKVSGVDEDGTPATFLQSIRLEGCRRVLRTEPFIFSSRDIRDTLDAGADFKIELEFMGHYGEPNLEIDINVAIVRCFIFWTTIRRRENGQLGWKAMCPLVVIRRML